MIAERVEWMKTEVLAGLIYSSPETQRMFIDACAAEARAILRRHADVVCALAAELVRYRTIDAATIDDVIARTVSARELTQEYERRRRWRETEARARSFAEQRRACSTMSITISR